jgi:SAM-dependent methyltransferase
MRRSLAIYEGVIKGAGRYSKMKKIEIKKVVRESYGKIAKEQKGCGCGTCGPDAREFAKGIGYSERELSVIPADANLGLSCGNPTALASLKKGETVLDLGSGAGFDSFLAAKKVGRTGKVIGVDMTPEMIEKARENARKGKCLNVDFRLGEIENIPARDRTADVVISNCVINLSSDKERVFHEIKRVLKPGGRIAISDIALKKSLPRKIQKSIEAYVGCIGGAVLVEDYKKMVKGAGFKDVKITVKGTSACIDPDTKDPIGRAILDSLKKDESLDDYVVSVYVEGRK